MLAFALFRRTSFCYVAVRTGHPNDLAVHIKQGTATVKNPDKTSILAAHAVLALVKGRLAAQVALQLCQGTLQIIRMHPARPFVKVRTNFVRAVPQHGLPAL